MYTFFFDTMRILISHIDLDGYGVNVLESIYSEYLRYDEIKNKNYGFEEEQEIKDLIEPENDITIVDLSIPEPVYLDWKSKVHSLIIIDHHESSKYIQNYEGNVWSDQLSGTALFWTYVVKKALVSCGQRWDKKIDYFVTLVDCYDRWQEDSMYWLDATRLNKVNQSLGSKFVGHMVNKLTRTWEWTSEETDCFETIEQEENRILSDIEKDLAIKADNNGYNFCLVEIPDKSKLSMVCSKLLTKYPEIDYVMGYNARNNSLSFRSKKDYINLTQIQGVFGHKLAAGGAYDPSDFYKLLLEDYCVSWTKDTVRKSAKILVEKIDR